MFLTHIRSWYCQCNMHMTLTFDIYWHWPMYILVLYTFIVQKYIEQKMVFELTLTFAQLNIYCYTEGLSKQVK